MNEDDETRNTAWGLIAGVGCVALFLFYAANTRAMPGSSRSCSTCRRVADVSQTFGGPSTPSETNK